MSSDISFLLFELFFFLIVNDLTSQHCSKNGNGPMVVLDPSGGSALTNILSK